MNPTALDPTHPVQQFPTHFPLSPHHYPNQNVSHKLRPKKEKKITTLTPRARNDDVDGHGGGGVAVSGGGDREVQNDAGEGEAKGCGGFRPFGLGGAEGRGVSEEGRFEGFRVGSQGVSDSRGFEGRGRRRLAPESGGP